MLGVKCWNGERERSNRTRGAERRNRIRGRGSSGYLIKSLLNPFKREGWRGRCVTASP